MGAPLGPVEVAARQRMSTQASSSHPGHRRMISMVHGGGNSRILVSRGKSRPIWRDFPSRPELAVIARGKWRVAPQILQAASATANVSPPQHNREKLLLLGVGYTLVSAFSACFCTTTLLGPGLVLHHGWGLPPEQLTETMLTLLRLAGSIGPTAVAISSVLCANLGARRSKHINARSLALGLFAMGTAQTVALSWAPAASSAWIKPMIAVGFIGTAALGAWGSNTHCANRVPLVRPQSCPADDHSRALGPAASVLALAASVAGAYCLASPSTALSFLGPLGGLGEFYGRITAAGLALSAQVFLTLKRAADCHALGVGSVIALTLGAGATALLQTTVLVHAISVAAVPWGGSVAAALALPMASLVLCSACYCTGLLHRVSRSRKRTA